MNDCLEVGDNYIPLIFDMLLKFRWNTVGLTEDIENAFLMVGIQEQDRDMLRFLWFDEPFASRPAILPVCFRCATITLNSWRNHFTPFEKIQTK